ncbi:MAG: LysR substrate-binding domain-containing protein [Pseudomonadota bacterium]
MVFEAAARKASFTLAAEELNVQQPAVSAAIKQLEQRLGVTLFVRQHRQVTLTSAGQRLFTDVRRGLDIMLNSARSVKELGREDYVTLSASSAFNFYWMMPRLADLHRVHPDIDLRLQASDREPDIDAENISLAVRRGDGTWPGCESTLIATEAIYPVAAPHLFEQREALNHHSDLLGHPLIHLEEPIRERPTWGEWFSHFGIEAKSSASGLRLNDYALVLQAAIAGEGFAFGWAHLTDPLVANGVLRAKQDWRWTTGLGFYLVWSSNIPLTSSAERVRDWIVQSRTPDVF